MRPGPAASALTTLPCRDWSSNRPSPVMINCAAATSSASRVSSAMIAAPDSRRPPSASSAAPIPPAAPAPGSAPTGRPADAVEFGRPIGQPLLEQRTVSGRHPSAGRTRRPRPSDPAAGVRRRWPRSGRHRPAGRVPRPARRARRPGRGRRRCSAAAEPDRRCGGRPRVRAASISWPTPVLCAATAVCTSAAREAAPVRTPAHTRCRRCPTRRRTPTRRRRRRPAAR